VHQRFRALLRDQLGIDPSPAVRGLQSAILTQDPRLDHTAGAVRSIPMVVPGPNDHTSPDELTGALIGALHAVANALAARVPSAEVDLAEIASLAAALSVAYEPPSVGGDFFASLVARCGPAQHGAHQVRDEASSPSADLPRIDSPSTGVRALSHPGSTEVPPGHNRVWRG
jgi:hypothetical protein